MAFSAEWCKDCAANIPLILIFSKEGTEKGRIVENPRVGLTLEEEILQIIQGNAEKL